ncbi:MarR family winged helix-turn-helix transcriptional regulator [Aureimonas phyllosphaerae]|uniref:MarR family winged helix-turn-helix transcriptional regulator n=1 Tax=Aureimonas phyllosphaerae TaxID=1166078 RepID=UPI003A5C0D96
MSLEKPDVLATPGHLVSVAARAFARLSEARLKPLGFGVGHLPVLVALETGRARTQRDLARLVRTEQPSMAQMLARMERDGQIRRSADPSDGRSNVIHVSDAAKASLPTACEALFQGNREALAGFSEAETAEFLALLRRLIDNLERLTSDGAAGT